MKSSALFRLRRAFHRRRRQLMCSRSERPGLRRGLVLESLDRRLVLSASPLGAALDADFEDTAGALGASMMPASQAQATTGHASEGGAHGSTLSTTALPGDDPSIHSFSTDDQGEGENHDEQHIHARLTIFVDSQPVTIPANIGVSATAFLAQLHTHDSSGELHVHPIGSEPRDTTLTLGDFFEVWRTNAGLAGNNPNATFSSNNLMGNVANTTSTVQMFVNGEISRDFENHVIQEGEEIVLVYGSNPVVSLNTTFGAIPIELFAEATPGTVDNFLNYVNRGDYLNSIFHRSVPDFVIQGGGFTTSLATFFDTTQFTAIPTDPPIQNEPGISNLRGTLAMAKLGGDPDSATSQFFVNLSDSNSFLDLPQNNSFTVFGQVLDMTAVDRIAALPVDTTNPSPFGELPLSQEDLLVVLHTIEGQGRISGTKFLDANGNGVRDAGEPGIANATVFLDANNNGILDPGEISTVTDAQGRYLFEVEPGTYTVRAVLSAEQQLTLPGGAGSHSATVEMGRETSNLHFGVQTEENGTTDPSLANSISGIVYLDSNGNGQRDPGEMGVPGSLITLSGTTAQGASVMRTALSQDDGVYQFLDLPSGTYQLVQQQPHALENGETSTSTAEVVRGDNQFTNIVLSGETVFSDLHFGERGLHPEYITVQWFLASTPNDAALLRETIAMGEERSGNMELAEAIRRGDSSLPSDALPNQAPVAANDAYTVDANSVLEVSAATGVLANDVDPEGQPLTAILVSGTTNGSLTLNSNGSFTYTPNTDFAGTDSFTYRAHDGELDSNTATVTITVEEVSTNSPPVAVDDTYSVVTGDTLSIDASAGVLTNDSDPDDDPLTAQLVSGPSSGQLTLDSDGSFSYIPNSGFSGTDTFTYQAHDGQAASNTATVTIQVQAVNNPPVAADDSYVVEVGDALVTSAAEGVLANDSDPDGDNLTAQLVTDVSHGILFLNADGSFTYLPEDGFAGTDSFTYRASDGSLTSDIATVTIEVHSDNLAPIAADDTYTAEVGESLVIDVFRGVLANDSDPDGDPLQAFLVEGPSDGTLTLNLNGSFTYTPDEQFLGTDTFTYRASDGQLFSQVATVTIQVKEENSPPVAADDQYATTPNTVLEVDAASGVLANDSDPDGDNLTALLVTGPSNGTVDLNIDGSFTYTPNSGFVGSDSFQYSASDGTLLSEAATVTIEVESENQPPVAVNDSYVVNPGETLVVDVETGVLANDSDPDGDDLTAILVAGTNSGTLTLNSDGSFTYQPNENFAGVDSFSYRAHDGELSSSIAMVTLLVSVENQQPVAVDDSYFVVTGETLVVDAAAGVLANDSDPLGADLTAVLVVGPSQGTLELNTDGSFTYEPNEAFVGEDSFTYQADNGEVLSEVANVVIDVQAENAPPVAEDDFYEVVSGESLIISAALGVLANDTDPDGDELTAEVVEGPEHGALVFHSDGSFIYDSFEEFVGTDTFTYRASDGDLFSEVATVTIDVTDVEESNDLPPDEEEDEEVEEDEEEQAEGESSWSQLADLLLAGEQDWLRN